MIKPYFLYLFLSFLFLHSNAVAQTKLTRISGVVRDSLTKEPLPFVNVVFVGKNVGTVTDYKGQYNISTQWGSEQLQASFMGYASKIEKVKAGENQKIDFELRPNQYALEEVTISAKRKGYRNKNNPAVELIRKVIARKKDNRKESLDFYEYDKYEKIEFDLNNISANFKNKRALKNFQFVFDYVDTSLINNKPYLPVFLKEKKSTVYYRKSPKTSKEYIWATNMVGFNDYVDEKGVSSFIENMYEKVDIYQNNIYFMTYDFVSPIADAGPAVYKYFILDTLNVNGYDCIRLGFQPRNKADFTFRGDMYITNDERYAVIKIKMRVSDQINLNFVNDLQIDQEFSYVNDKVWMLDKDELVIDFNIGKKGLGVFGRKHVSYQNYVFDQERDKSIYNNIQKVIIAEDHDEKTADYWRTARHAELTPKEQGIFTMVDSIQNVPAFKTTMDIVFFLMSGYLEAGPVDIGPFNGFYSFNDVEGDKIQFGGRTNPKFSNKWMIEAKLGYGFKDERWKYSLGMYHFLNNKHYLGYPRHYIKTLLEEESVFPGMQLQNFNSDNFLLSFKRGVADKILYQRKKEVEYYREMSNGLRFTIALRHNIHEAGGDWTFNFKDYSLNSITSSELEAGIRFAPNEKFYQGKGYRVPITTKHPILELNYIKGFKKILNGDYDYHKIRLYFQKRVFMSQLGYSDVKVEGAKLWGNVPLPLLLIQAANQTYTYQTNSFNMMNFMEFVADQYISLKIEHYFNGFFLNKIPLFKKLKFREFISVKGVYGSLRDENNPGINPEAMHWPVNEDMLQTTYTLAEKPYIEMSAGIHNIFKVLQIAVVRRMNYLDHPNVDKYGFRMRLIVEF